MKAFKNYGISHLLATLIVTTLVALIPFGYPLVFHTQMDFRSTAMGLAGLCYAVMIIIGVPTELRLRAKHEEPSLARAYGTYALTGLAGAVVLALFYFAMYSMSDWVLPVLIAVVFYVIYMLIMFFTRGIFVPIELALRKVFPLKSNPTENEATDVLH